MNEVIVVRYNSNWPGVFEAECKRIASVLSEEIVIVYHIGSTAIPGIYAKPIIDMLVEVVSLDGLDSYNDAMAAIGYEVMGEFGIAGRRYFRKDVDGIRTYQIHAFQTGSSEIVRHLAFRNYLIANPDEARTYSELKRHLTNGPNVTSDEYIDGKAGFIAEIDRKTASLQNRD